MYVCVKWKARRIWKKRARRWAGSGVAPSAGKSNRWRTSRDEPGEARPGRGAVAPGDEPLQLGLELGEEEVDREVLIERALFGTRVRVGDESLAEGAREGVEARGERRDVLVPRGLAGEGVPDRRRGHEVAPEGAALRAHPVGEEGVREEEVRQASREGALRLGHEGHRDSLGALRQAPVRSSTPREPGHCTADVGRTHAQSRSSTRRGHAATGKSASACASHPGTRCAHPSRSKPDIRQRGEWRWRRQSEGTRDGGRRGVRRRAAASSAGDADARPTPWPHP